MPTLVARLLACIWLLLLGALPAMAADTYFPTPGGGGVNGAVGMCLNAASQAVPCSDPAALPQALGSTSGGWTPTLFAALSTTVQTVKSSAGQVGKLYCDNPNATPIYVEIFDTVGTVTLGTTAPKQAYYIPANNAAGFSLALVGDQYLNAIKIAAVTTVNGVTAPGVAGNCNVSWH